METESSIPNTQGEARSHNENLHKGRGHRQRLRDRFLAAGLDGFQDYEVIELLLTLGTPRKDCKEAAKAALTKFKTLQAVIEASPTQLCEVKGIGPKNLFGIKLIQAVADRHFQKKLIHKDPINNSKELFDYLYHSLRDKQREFFKAIFLDSKNRVISTETLSEGTLTASSVYPREVVQAALNHHAAAVIFAHNHPSGDPKPSQDDISITRQLVFAGRVMGITVHEHIIIGSNRFFSFADHGYMNQMNQDADALMKSG
jgi:DNA repair protein RadC